VGFEGAGKVVFAGKNGQNMIDRNVCFTALDKDSTGSYADYALVKSSNCTPLPDNVD